MVFGLSRYFKDEILTKRLQMASNIKSEGTAPPNHRIFTGTWSINTVKKRTKSDKNKQKNTDVEKPQK